MCRWVKQCTLSLVMGLMECKKWVEEKSSKFPQNLGGGVHQILKYPYKLSEFSNYIQFGEGVKAEGKKTNPWDRLESSEAARARCEVSHQG